MILRHRVKRRESTCPRYVVTVAARREAEGREGEGEASLAQRWLCGQKLLFPYKAPLSRTILLEWLRKMPNRGTLGIAVSSAAVSSDRGKNSTATLGLDRFRPAALAAAVRLCGEIVVALSPPCPCPSSLYIAVVLRGARALFFEGVRVYGECAEKGKRQLARGEKGQESERERKTGRERKREGADQCNISGQCRVRRVQT